MAIDADALSSLFLLPGRRRIAAAGSSAAFTMKRSAAIASLGAAVLATRVGAEAQSVTDLKAAGVPEESATPVLWAQQSGLFRRNGLAVELDPQRSGTAIAAGVAGGGYQIGKSSIIPLITAFAKGIPFVLVAPGGLYRASKPHIAMIVAKDSPITTAAGMNGKTLGVSALDDLYTLGIKTWIDKNGGDSTTLKIVELPLPAITDAIVTGRIDAGGSATPALSASLASGKVRVLAHMFDAIAPEFMYTAWFSTKSYVASEPTLVRAFSQAERQAAAYVNEHPAQTVGDLSKFTGIGADIIAKMTRAQMGTTLDPKLIQPVVDVCVRYKVIPAPINAADMIASGLG
jgi:NitT/TauT family transport system substrate-binding protein